MSASFYHFKLILLWVPSKNKHPGLGLLLTVCWNNFGHESVSVLGLLELLKALQHLHLSLLCKRIADNYKLRAHNACSTIWHIVGISSPHVAIAPCVQWQDGTNLRGVPLSQYSTSVWKCRRAAERYTLPSGALLPLYLPLKAHQ